MADIVITKEVIKARPVSGGGSVWGQLRVQAHAVCAAGTVVCSDWIDSTLGPGAALLSVGLLSVSRQESNLLVFGQPGLFGAEMAGRLPEVDISRMLDADTGRFKVALQFRKDWTGGDFSLVWNAFSAAGPLGQGDLLFADAQGAGQKAAEEVRSGNSAAEGTAPDNFFIQNPPRILHVGWRYTLRTNMDRTGIPVQWRVNPGEGEINGYGEYTAPEKAGMYEVTAIRENDGRKASVYVVVMK